jgi:hypothetical protein
MIRVTLESETQFKEHNSYESCDQSFSKDRISDYIWKREI